VCGLLFIVYPTVSKEEYLVKNRVSSFCYHFCDILINMEEKDNTRDSILLSKAKDGI